MALELNQLKQSTSNPIVTDTNTSTVYEVTGNDGSSYELTNVETGAVTNNAALGVSYDDTTAVLTPLNSLSTVNNFGLPSPTQIGSEALGGVKQIGQTITDTITDPIGFAKEALFGPDQQDSQRKNLTKIVAQDQYRCKLTSSITQQEVIFYVTPNVDESRSAQYDAVSPVHHPGTIQVYKTTMSRNININAKLIARNRKEATRNIMYMNTLRSWVMPFYGQGTLENAETKNRIGSPPEVLIINAYGKYNLTDIPVVLANYSWTYPDDLDYIPTYPMGEDKEIVSCPRMLDISLTLMESYAPSELSNFDLVSYKRGELDRAYNKGTPKKFLKSTKASDIFDPSKG